MVNRYYTVKKEDKYLLVLSTGKHKWINDLHYARFSSNPQGAKYLQEVYNGDTVIAVDEYEKYVHAVEVKEVDDALERVLRGKIYTAQGYIMIPFEEQVKAIDEEDAKEIISSLILPLDGDYDNVELDIDKIIEKGDDLDE